MGNDLRAIPRLIGQLFQTVQALNKIFPHSPFTPGGRLIGSIGEVVAAYTYGLILDKCSHKGFDAKIEAQQHAGSRPMTGQTISHYPPRVAQ